MAGIAPIWEKSNMPVTSLQGRSVTGESGKQPFTDIFQTAIDGVRETDNEVSEMEYLMATGQLDNPANLLIAQSKATTAVSLLVDLRNKAMEGYNELLRMSL